MIKAILFDLDGTLLDTREFIYRAFEHTFERHNLPVIARDSLAKLMGGSLESIYEGIAPFLDCHVLCDTHRSFQEANLHLSVLFPYVEITLDTLRKRGIKLAVVTTRSKRTSIRTLETAGIDAYFDVVVSGEDVTRLKPDPEPLLYALGKLGIPANQSAMVGDTEADVLAGKSAGAYTVAVTYGFAGRGIIQSNPDLIIEDIRAVLQL